MAIDKLKDALGAAEIPGAPEEVPPLGKPPAGNMPELLAGFLNPETGEATSVRPDPAGWPKAEVTPGAPELELPELKLPEAPAGAAPPPAGAAPKPPVPPGAGLPKPPLEAPKLPNALPGIEEVQLSNPETGEATRIAPDPAGWPKAEISPGLPDPLKQLAGGAPEMPQAPGAPKPPAAAGAKPDLPKLPEVELPGGAELTTIEGLETGDLTEITPDSAGWPKASVTPGAPKALPDQLAGEPPAVKPPEALQQAKAQAESAAKIPK